MAYDQRSGRHGRASGRSSGPRNSQRIRDRLQDRDTRPITIALLAVCVLLLVVLAGWIYAIRDLPSDVEVDRSRFEESSIVYSADGQELTRYQDRNRTWVPLEEISQEVIDALLAVEDHRFYSHSGIDVRRTISSIIETLGGDVQGGSTLTMQFARNAFPSLADDPNIVRKVKEWIVALKLEGRYEKDDILEMYLNTVPFMYNAFGIEAAAQTYFQKSADELNLTEAATLVGMLRGTSYYNPVRNPERSHERRNVVLQQMVEHDFLDRETYESVRDEETELNFRRISRTDNMAPYFAEYLRLWLDEWAEENQYNLYTDGLRIHTTLDSRLQELAEEAVHQVGDDLQAVADVEWSSARPPMTSSNASAYRNYRDNVEPFAYFWESNPELLDRFLQRTQRYRLLQQNGVSAEAALDSLRSNEALVDSVRTVYQTVQAALVAMDPETGEVKAWVGGRDFERTQYDNVAQSRRQPGSTFKPFVYATALQQGYRSTDMVRDRDFEFVDPTTGQRWEPQNVGGTSGDLMTLADGLAYSKNTITAQVTVDVGPQRVAELAHRMGIESDLAAVPSIGLGTSSVSLLEMTAAYATIADMGEYDEPQFVARIEDQDGRVVAQFRSSSRRALPPETTYELIEMMKGVVEYGTGVRMRNVYGATGEVAGKTGTSQDGADGWFMFMHPNMVVGSWVGFPTSAITFRNSYWEQGSHTALPIVGTFYRSAQQAGTGAFSGGSWPRPAGYSPPPSPDSIRFASDDSRFDSILDSLRQETEDFLAQDEDIEFDDDFDDDLELGDTLTGGQPSAPDESEPEGPPLEELSEADSLNRIERTGGIGNSDPDPEPDENNESADIDEEEEQEEDDQESSSTGERRGW